jgi:hypothetical protein
VDFGNIQLIKEEKSGLSAAVVLGVADTSVRGCCA